MDGSVHNVFYPNSLDDPNALQYSRLDATPTSYSTDIYNVMSPPTPHDELLQPLDNTFAPADQTGLPLTGDFATDLLLGGFSMGSQPRQPVHPMSGTQHLMQPAMATPPSRSRASSSSQAMPPSVFSDILQRGAEGWRVDKHETSKSVLFYILLKDLPHDMRSSFVTNPALAFVTLYLYHKVPIDCPCRRITQDHKLYFEVDFAKLQLTLPTRMFEKNNVMRTTVTVTCNLFISSGHGGGKIKAEDLILVFSDREDTSSSSAPADGLTSKITIKMEYQNPNANMLAQYGLVAGAASRQTQSSNQGNAFHANPSAVQPNPLNQRSPQSLKYSGVSTPPQSHHQQRINYQQPVQHQHQGHQSLAPHQQPAQQRLSPQQHPRRHHQPGYVPSIVGDSGSDYRGSTSTSRSRTPSRENKSSAMVDDPAVSQLPQAPYSQQDLHETQYLNCTRLPIPQKIQANYDSKLRATQSVPPNAMLSVKEGYAMLYKIGGNDVFLVGHLARNSITKTNNGHNMFTNGTSEFQIVVKLPVSTNHVPPQVHCQVMCYQREGDAKQKFVCIEKVESLRHGEWVFWRFSYDLNKMPEKKEFFLVRRNHAVMRDGKLYLLVVRIDGTSFKHPFVLAPRKPTTNTRGIGDDDLEDTPISDYTNDYTNDLDFGLSYTAFDSIIVEEPSEKTATFIEPEYSNRDQYVITRGEDAATKAAAAAKAAAKSPRPDSVDELAGAMGHLSLHQKPKQTPKPATDELYMPLPRSRSPSQSGAAPRSSEAAASATEAPTGSFMKPHGSGSALSTPTPRSPSGDANVSLLDVAAGGGNASVSLLDVAAGGAGGSHPGPDPQHRGPAARRGAPLGANDRRGGTAHLGANAARGGVHVEDEVKAYTPLKPAVEGPIEDMDCYAGIMSRGKTYETLKGEGDYLIRLCNDPKEVIGKIRNPNLFVICHRSANKVGNLKVFRSADGKYQNAKLQKDVTVTKDTVAEFIAALVPNATNAVKVNAYLGKAHDNKKTRTAVYGVFPHA